MYRLGLVDMIFTHANTKGFDLTSLSGVRRGFMPPQLRTTKIKNQSRGISTATGID